MLLRSDGMLRSTDVYRAKSERQDKAMQAQKQAYQFVSRVQLASPRPCARLVKLQTTNVDERQHAASEGDKTADGARSNDLCNSVSALRDPCLNEEKSRFSSTATVCFPCTTRITCTTS